MSLRAFALRAIAIVIEQRRAIVPRQYWLMKCEPEAYTIQDLAA